MYNDLLRTLIQESYNETLKEDPVIENITGNLAHALAIIDDDTDECHDEEETLEIANGHIYDVTHVHGEITDKFLVKNIANDFLLYTNDHGEGFPIIFDTEEDAKAFLNDIEVTNNKIINTDISYFDKGAVTLKLRG